MPPSPVQKKHPGVLLKDRATLDQESGLYDGDSNIALEVLQNLDGNGAREHEEA